MAELSQPADEALAAAAARGEAAAFEQLVRRHERVVRGFLARLAGAGRADDLAQETFLTAWTKASAFTGEGRYKGWLMRIAWRMAPRTIGSPIRVTSRETKLPGVPRSASSSDTMRPVSSRPQVDALTNSDSLSPR